MQNVPCCGVVQGCVAPLVRFQMKLRRVEANFNITAWLHDGEARGFDLLRRCHSVFSEKRVVDRAVKQCFQSVYRDKHVSGRVGKRFGDFSRRLSECFAQHRL